jgi:GT2 family glycosyltransferase
MRKPLVSVIIVNWNGIKYLPDCLTTLKKITYSPIEVIFVDNNSTDTSLLYAKKNYPSMHIIKNQTNLGYAQGHAKALQKAKGDAILLLSTDTILKSNVFDEMVNVLYSSKNIGVVQPKLLLFGENNKIDSIGMFFNKSGMLYHYGRAKNASLPQYNKQMEIFSAKGACMLFRKEVLKITGLFDKDYFAYFEETDLCHRIWLSGYKIVYAPKAEVIHKGGGASKQMLPSYIYFHSYKNRICTYLKNLSIPYLIPVLLNTMILYEVLTIVYLVHRKFRNAVSVQQAILWNITHFLDTLKKRKFIQTNIRKINDDEFLPQITRSVRLSYFYHMYFDLSKYNSDKKD